MIRTLIQDVLLAMLLGVVAVVMFILPSVKPAATTDPIDPPGNLVASAAWPPGSIDVDLWVKSPGDEAVGYSRKSGTVWSLQHAPELRVRVHARAPRWRIHSQRALLRLRRQDAGPSVGRGSAGDG
ncbi:hypothetical protein [Shinella sp.]|uniref:hypothetical protein n=1 Tax=Shinella sp. TaxID=1870904 RepID=UPI0028A76964|nr:hypothetical protein [Shinella sp.]